MTGTTQKADTAALEASGPETCLACGAEILGPYCHLCGQKDDDCRRSIVSLAGEVVRDAAALDGRFLRTCRESILKPGRHLRRYAHGERSPYTPPVRYFFVILFVFFGTLWAMDRNILVLQLIPVEQADGREAEESNIDLSIEEGDPLDEVDLPPKVRQRIDEGLASIEDLPPELRDSLEPQVAEALRQAEEQRRAGPQIVPYGGFFLPARDLTYTEEEKEWVRSNITVDGDARLFGRELSGARISEALIFTMQYPAAFNNALNEAIPVLLLLFVPLMAILGAVFIRGRDALVYDHLLLSIQTHAFAFVILILTLWTSPILPGDVGALAFFLGVPLYYLLSAKGAFGRSWRKTIAATVFVGMFYNTLFFIGLVMAVLFAFWEIS